MVVYISVFIGLFLRIDVFVGILYCKKKLDLKILFLILRFMLSNIV